MSIKRKKMKKFCWYCDNSDKEVCKLYCDCYNKEYYKFNLWMFISFKVSIWWTDIKIWWNKW
jgi:hypothetical protein